MALRRSVNNIEIVNDGRHVVLRIRSIDQIQLEKHLFQRYPSREWGTFFRFGYRRTNWGLALSYVDSLWPIAGDLDRQSGMTVFRDQYTHRAFQTAAKQELAIGVVHSHPEGYKTYPSELDDDMDEYFSRELAAFSRGAPYLSFILQRSDETGLTFTGRVFDRGEWLPLSTIFSIGQIIERANNDFGGFHASPAIMDMNGAESVTARLESVFGDASAKRLKDATVGVVGCSGTGSPALGVLARAGVGEFVIVDPQRFSRSNLERMHGSSWSDAQAVEPPYKVDQMCGFIKSINPAAKVTALIGNILQENVIDEFLRCDVVLGCTDTFHARVALSDLAHHFLLPSLDLGVLMEGQNGTVSSQLIEPNCLMPDFPCVFCCGLIDSAALAEELMTERERAERRAAAALAESRGVVADQYWKGKPRQLHTVGYLTTIAGALGAGYLEGWLTGTFIFPHNRFQFDIGKPKFAVVVPSSDRQPECSCGKFLGWAQQAIAHRNISLPSHWPKRAILASRS